MRTETHRDVSSAPDAQKLSHRGRRRGAFMGAGAALGALIGLVGWTVVDISGGAGRSSAVISILALAVAGGLGGTIIGALMEVSIEDGENEKLAEEAREDPSAPLDETDAADEPAPGVGDDEHAGLREVPPPPR